MAEGFWPEPRPGGEPAGAGSGSGSAGSGGGDLDDLADLTRPAGVSETDMLMAALRQEAGELDACARVLTETLADALPPTAVTVRRRQTLGDRMRGRPGEVVELVVRLDQRALALRSERGRIDAEILNEVRGIALSRQQVNFEVWLTELAQGITAAAASSARSRAALARFLSGG